MRLLNTRTAELRWFNRNEIPPYAILSHVWGKHEQSLQDIIAICPRPTFFGTEDDFGAGVSDRPLVRKQPLDGRLSAKIRGCCDFAASLGYHWIWNDTCCIDKTSSSELSEAINSMFSWYAHADVCIAYLDDVSDGRAHNAELERSKWFTRGFTLQELIAPPVVLFASRGWTLFGTKASLAQRISKITGIDSRVLTFHRQLSGVSIAERMLWASSRNVTRIEDEAYSLQGLFGINMPVLYGEGKAAFRRLQEEIMKVSPDQTLFAWTVTSPRRGGLMATRPSQFTSMDMEHMRAIPIKEIPKAAQVFCDAALRSGYNLTMRDFRGDTPSFVNTSHGILARLPLIRCRGHWDEIRDAVAILAVKFQSSYVGVHLRRMSHASTIPHYTVERRGFSAAGTAGLGERLMLVGPDSTFEFPFRPPLHYDGANRYTLEWTDIYICDTPKYTLAPAATPLTLTIPSWVHAKLSRLGLVEVKSASTDRPSDRSKGVFAGAAYNDGQTTVALTFRYVSPVEDRRSREEFRVLFTACCPPDKIRSPQDVLVSAKITGHGGPAAAQPIRRNDGLAHSFGDSRRNVTLTFGLAKVDEEEREYMLDIDVAGSVYDALARLYSPRADAAAPARELPGMAVPHAERSEPLGALALPGSRFSGLLVHLQVNEPQVADAAAPGAEGALGTLRPEPKSLSPGWIGSCFV